MFLAEVVRSRRTSLKRAAEISHRVLNFLPHMKNESEALSLLSEIEKDFEEVTVLKKALHFGYKNVDTKVFENEIKDFAAKIFVKDIGISASFLQDAARPDMDIQKLCLKYPEFCDYLLSDPQKQELLQGFKLA